MANISILDQTTINQIAAGEVIERPASVVKELLENAIDAKATAITVEVKDGGTTFIRITDNGCGIAKAEIAVAFLRHSTSKIKSVEDLVTVSSLGFRGEALSSIAAVAQVELITKTNDSLTGARYQIEGGEERLLEDIGAPEGTTFLVRSLFFNTPARRKFLKSPTTEGTYISELVERIALSHPEISIRFINNNQNKLHTSGNHNLKDMIYTIFGREIAANLLPVHIKAHALKISGFIGKPVIARGNRNYENYFINGRYIKSSLISKAIEDAFKPFMMQHKYPFTALHFSISPDFLDVNVHPTKMELRFRDGELVYRTVVTALHQALTEKELIPEINFEDKKQQSDRGNKTHGPMPEPFEQKRLAATAAPAKPDFLNDLAPLKKKLMAGGTDNVKTSPGSVLEEDYLNVPDKKEKTQVLREANGYGIGQDKLDTSSESLEQMTLFEDKLLLAKTRFKHKLIGQLFDTYWLVEFREQLFIVDQHAAHEKVLFEKTMASLKSRDYTSQMISPPIILTLSMGEEQLLIKYMDYFTSIGFEIEHFGGKEYAVRGIPDNLFSIAKKELLMEIIDHLSEDFGNQGSVMINEKIASISCKAAVKGNQQLSAKEADRLLDYLLDLENPYTCPHGRPTIVSMSKYELERKFKRIL